jgi:hypothetical protein
LLITSLFTSLSQSASLLPASADIPEFPAGISVISKREASALDDHRLRFINGKVSCSDITLPWIFRPLKVRISS